jgi:hypothetical protein
MIKGDIHNKVQSKIKEVITRIPHSLNQEQEKLVGMIAQEILLDIIEDIQVESQDTESKKELNKIKKTWKEFNKLLQ